MMSRPRYYIDTRWSDQHREMRWCVIDGDTGNPIGGRVEVSFYKAEDALTMCNFMNSQDANGRA
jgi:hypothetical protein